ncbi:histidine kinase N-terminal 7TM domain-containing protein [Paenibacillus sp. PL2-23]|uniref:sensor histidine kinase n=1 Tax=Paenibacillus sp. PL2-23 TaxID=2100729 RepID=UPI0030FC3F0A
MSYNLYLSVMLMAATGCSLILAYLCWQRREQPIAISYGLGLLTGAFYSMGYAFEIVSTNLEQIRFWLRIEYLGIPFGTVFWFLLVLQYTGRQALVRRRLVILLLIVPAITFIAHYTNEWHHWFYTSMSLNMSEGFPTVVLEKGPLYYLHVFFSYILFVIGMVMLVQMFRKATPSLKKQVGFMIIGSWGPYGFTLIYLSGIMYMPIDFSPFGFLFSGVFYLWGIYQFNMLRLAPLALQKVFGTMKDAVMVFDMDHSLTSYNQSAAGIIASLDQNWIGAPAPRVFGEHPVLLDKLRSVPSFTGKVQLGMQGEDRFYHVHITIIADRKQKPVGKVMLLSDVTETVRYEEKLLDSAKQLSELNLFKDKMFNRVAHDIRNPLAVLVNLMELMEDELRECGERHSGMAQEMSRQIHHTFILVEGLLDWFHSQKGGMLLHPHEVNLAAVVEASMALLGVRSEAKGIGVVSQIPEDMRLLCDPEMLAFIIRNLLTNAIKFTDAGGRVSVKAERAEPLIIVAISDTGEGIDPDQARALWQEGYSMSSAGTAGERGIGLGLAICKEFVRLNGGDIWVESSPGLGSTFYFSLPASRVEQTRQAD